MSDFKTPGLGVNASSLVSKVRERLLRSPALDLFGSALRQFSRYQREPVI
jgi:hypothetical protein